MRPIIIEARNDARGTVEFRFTCNRCNVEGKWQDSLNDAERSGHRHNRNAHGEGIAEA